MDDLLDPSNEIASEKQQRRLVRYLLDQNALLRSRLDLLESIQSVQPWTSFDPTWTNLTIGNAVQTCKYVQIGKLVVARYCLVLGSSSSVGSDPYATLPVDAALWGNANINKQHLGTAWYTDASGNYSSGPVHQGNTNTATFSAWTSSGTYVTPNAVTGSVPWTWATSDTIEATIQYEGD